MSGVGSPTGYVVAHTDDADLWSLIPELVRIATELRDVVLMTGE